MKLEVCLVLLGLCAGSGVLAECKRGQIRCGTGREECFSPSTICSVVPRRIARLYEQCSNGWERRKCHSACDSDEFWCNDQCLSAETSMCDGKRHCSDGWDEEGCCGRFSFNCTSNNQCVRGELRCDGVPNCSDGSDEENCTSCKPSHFVIKCRNQNKCVFEVEVCDGVQNCIDGSDEMLCRQCKGGAFQCDDKQRCVSKGDRCDGVRNCIDGSDEVNCTTCSGGAFLCNNSRHCVPAEHRCDGVSWCSEGSDEVDCSNRTSNSTACPAETRCNGVQADCAWHDEVGCTASMCRYPASPETFCDGRCLSTDRVCDGKNDCKDGSDEASCGECDRGDVFCDGECKKGRRACDGVRDCVDGRDEANCTSCSGRAFMCDGHHCVRFRHRCDGVQWCVDGTDELGCNNVTASFTACRAETRCDGVQDGCYTKDDEAGCSPGMCRHPATSKTFCDGRCLPASKWCDGVKDCSDAHDEEDCPESNIAPGRNASGNFTGGVSDSGESVASLSHVMVTLKNYTSQLVTLQNNYSSQIVTLQNYSSQLVTLQNNYSSQIVTLQNYSSQLVTLQNYTFRLVAMDNYMMAFLFTAGIVALVAVIVWKFRDRCFNCCPMARNRDGGLTLEMEDASL